METSPRDRAFKLCIKNWEVDPSWSPKIIKNHLWKCGFSITKGDPHPQLTIAWWLIPLSKWFITPVINGISRVNPLTKWDKPPSGNACLTMATNGTSLVGSTWFNMVQPPQPRTFTAETTAACFCCNRRPAASRNRARPMLCAWSVPLKQCSARLAESWKTVVFYPGKSSEFTT